MYTHSPEYWALNPPCMKRSLSTYNREGRWGYSKYAHILVWEMTYWPQDRRQMDMLFYRTLLMPRPGAKKCGTAIMKGKRIELNAEKMKRHPVSISQNNYRKTPSYRGRGSGSFAIPLRY